MRKWILSVFAILVLAPVLSVPAYGMCTATYDECGNGCGFIGCEGTYSCLVGDGYVECDGERTYCPPSCYICREMIFCDDGTRLTCKGTNDCSSASGCWVYCDYQTQYCPGASIDPSCPLVN